MPSAVIHSKLQQEKAARENKTGTDSYRFRGDTFCPKLSHCQIYLRSANVFARAQQVLLLTECWHFKSQDEHESILQRFLSTPGWCSRAAAGWPARLVQAAQVPMVSAPVMSAVPAAPVVAEAATTAAATTVAATTAAPTTAAATTAAATTAAATTGAVVGMARTTEEEEAETTEEKEEKEPEEEEEEEENEDKKGDGMVTDSADLCLEVMKGSPNFIFPDDHTFVWVAKFHEWRGTSHPSQELVKSQTEQIHN